MIDQPVNRQIMRQKGKVVVFMSSDVEYGWRDVQIFSWSGHPASDVGKLINLKPAVFSAPPKRDGVHDEAGVNRSPRENASWT